MITTLLAGYTAVAAVLAVHALAHLPLRPVRGEYLDLVDRAALVAVAVLASAGWVLMVPVLISGWIASGKAALLAAAARVEYRRLRGRLAHAVGVHRAAH